MALIEEHEQSVLWQAATRKLHGLGRGHALEGGVRDNVGQRQQRRRWRHSSGGRRRRSGSRREVCAAFLRLAVSATPLVVVVLPFLLVHVLLALVGGNLVHARSQHDALGALLVNVDYTVAVRQADAQQCRGHLLA